MAIYEYECKKCKRIYSIIKPMSKCNKKEKCTICNSIMKRKISKNTNFILKGGGFYQTDYKNKDET